MKVRKANLCRRCCASKRGSNQDAEEEDNFTPNSVVWEGSKLYSLDGGSGGGGGGWDDI